jgi:hypothetical protein
MEKQQTEKQWWAPVWKGLVMDPDAKHYRQIKAALWLYLYFLLNANRQTGVLMRKIETICRDMGVTRDTAARWLHVLRTHGYVVTANTGRSLTIQVAHWKPLPGVGKTRPQKSESSNTRYRTFPAPLLQIGPQIPVQNGQKSSIVAAANETKIKIIINNDRPRRRATGTSVEGFTSIAAYARQELLARELAEALDDWNGIALYRSFSAKYPERLLRNVLADVQNVPTERITKGRGALFNYLVQFYAKGTTEDAGD